MEITDLFDINHIHKHLERANKRKDYERSEQRKHDEKMLADKVRLEIEHQKRLKQERLEKEEAQKQAIKDSINLIA